MSNKNNLRYTLGALALSVSAAPLATLLEVQQSTGFWTPGKPNPSTYRSPLLVSIPLGLPHCLQVGNVAKRLQKLEDITSLNDDNRAVATPGHRASVDYVKRILQKAGYKASMQPFPFTARHLKGPGSLNITVSQPVIYEWEKDLTYLSQAETGDATTKVAPVDLSLGAGNTSISGCETEDFANFLTDPIALIQHGICNFKQKAENAMATGAAGVTIFNQDNTDDRKGLKSTTVSESYEGGIPAIFAIYGNDAAQSQIPDLQLHLVVDVVRKRIETYNVVTRIRHSNPNNVVMVGAHLDSVFKGPGIDGNGPGSAVRLEMAMPLAKALLVNKVRFAWWGVGETDLMGSIHYVQNLTPEEKKEIKAYLNFGMIGSPNFGNFIHGDDNSDFGLQGPPGSATTKHLLEAYFRLRGQQLEDTEVDFRSDYAKFFDSGTASGDLFTSVEGLKTEGRARRYGDTADKAHGKCYHSKCDGIANINQDVLEIHSGAMTFVASRLSLSTKAVDGEVVAAGQKVQSRSLQMQKSASQIGRWGHDFIK